MIAATDILKDAFALIGVTEYTDTVEGRLSTPAVRMLNNMLYTWSADPYLNPKIGSTTVNSTAMTNGYITVGSADPTNNIVADIMDISKVTVSLGNLTYPALNKISYQDYQAIPLKVVQSIPYSYAFDYQNPLGKIYLYPYPTSSLVIKITYTPLIGVISTPSDLLDLPPWYADALVQNLACRLAPLYPESTGTNSSLIYLAGEAKRAIKERTMAMHNFKSPSPYDNDNCDSIWTSPINMLGA